jgi:hypothetical protein
MSLPARLSFRQLKYSDRSTWPPLSGGHLFFALCFCIVLLTWWPRLWPDFGTSSADVIRSIKSRSLQPPVLPSSVPRGGHPARCGVRARKPGLHLPGAKTVAFSRKMSQSKQQYTPLKSNACAMILQAYTNTAYPVILWKRTAPRFLRKISALQRGLRAQFLITGDSAKQWVLLLLW